VICMDVAFVAIFFFAFIRIIGTNIGVSMLKSFSKFRIYKFFKTNILPKLSLLYWLK
jgi:hypothetical protein